MMESSSEEHYKGLEQNDERRLIIGELFLKQKGSQLSLNNLIITKPRDPNHVLMIPEMEN